MDMMTKQENFGLVIEIIMIFLLEFLQVKINQDYHLVHYDELERARCSSHRPFPASYKYLMFDFHDYQKIDKLTIKAILETCETMLNPPAQLLGINGIWKFSKEILKWKQFSDYKLRTAGVTNYFQISHDGELEEVFFANSMVNF